MPSPGSKRGKNFYAAACHGVWYVAVYKKGTIQSGTNFSAWEKYVPRPEWLTSLWNAHKLDHEEYFGCRLLSGVATLIVCGTLQRSL